MKDKITMCKLKNTEFELQMLVSLLVKLKVMQYVPWANVITPASKRFL